MDNRLALTAGLQRPSHLRDTDLPNVAMAITVYVRGVIPVQVSVGVVGGAKVVVLLSQHFQVAVLGEDWALIDPYVQSDTFSPLVIPPYAGYQVSDPSLAYNPSVVYADPLYQRVLDLLKQLFPAKYPTSTY